MVLTKCWRNHCYEVPYSFWRLQVHCQAYSCKKKRKKVKERNRVPKVSKRVGDISCSHCQKSPKRAKLHNCNIYAECLCQSHGGYLVVGLDFVSPYKPRLVDSVSFLVVFLTHQTPAFLSPLPSLQDSQTLPNVCLQVSASASIICWVTPL